jgi:hypothetical protein
VGDVATTLYYTFSTIAQSLAAAIALLATFVLFRMQTLQAEIERRSDALLEFGFDTSVKSAAKDAQARGDVRSVLEITSVRISTPDNRVDSARRRLKALFRHEQSLMRAFWTSTVVSVALVTAALVAVSRVPEIIQAGWDAFLVDASLWWFVVCLGSYAWVLRAALGSTSRHER